MKEDEKTEAEQTIYKASKLNRGLLSICLIFVLWNFFNVRSLSKSTSEMNSKFVQQKIAVDANTKQLLDFMGQWAHTQQELSNWIQQNKQVQDKIWRDNPKLKIPKAPPVPPGLPPAQVYSTPEPRPTPKIEYRTKVKRVRAPTPKPWYNFFKPKSTR